MKKLTGLTLLSLSLLLAACGQLGVQGQVLAPTQPPTSTVPPTVTVPPIPTSTAAPVRLRAAVRAADGSLKLVDTGVAAGQSSRAPALLPTGGASGDTAFVFDIQKQEPASAVSGTGVRALDFVRGLNYGLAVWPGRGADGPRLAWGTTPASQYPLVSTLFIAAADGASVTPVVTVTVQQGQPPYELVAQRWSDDGQSLYFSQEPFGIGGAIPYMAASSLYRYRLADQTVTALIPFDASGGKMVCLDDLSPDASLVAGHCADPKSLTVHPLNGGADRTITGPANLNGYSVVGGARFSPDGQRVAFGLATGDPSAAQGWVAVSDGLSGESKLVMPTPTGTYGRVAAWLNDHTLLIQYYATACNPACGNSVWTVDLDGAHLSKVADGDFLALVGAD